MVWIRFIRTHAEYDKIKFRMEQLVLKRLSIQYFMPNGNGINLSSQITILVHLTLLSYFERGCNKDWNAYKLFIQKINKLAFRVLNFVQ